MIREKINIQLFAPHAKPGMLKVYEINAGATVAHFLRETKIIKKPDRFITLINGRNVKSETELKDGDTLSIVLFLDGG